MEKVEFKIDQYNFRIIKCEISNCSKDKIKNNNLFYYLLVDDDNFIHDYKVIFNEISITEKTTKSHENKTTDSLILRKKLINKLGLTPKWNEEKNKPKEIFHFDIEKINELEINEWSFKQDWRLITFQGIEYILRGSNPPGQGRGKGYFKIKYDETFNEGKQDNLFGFLFQCLNISSDIDEHFINVDYSGIWGKLLHKNIKPISFDTWTKHEKDIKKHFDMFITFPNKWKEYMDKFKKEVKTKKCSWIKLENKIQKYRRQYSINIDKLYSKSNKVFYEYFNLNFAPTKFQKAHIKPVWKIKKEFNETKNENILKEISDPNNFLPLPADVHELYDDYFFYWDINGNLVKLKENLNEHQVDKYVKIKNNKVLSSLKYLRDYIKIINNR